VERFLPVAGPVGRRRFGSVLGVVANYASVLRLPSAQGRFIGFPDEVHQAAVCVIGAQLARALFGYRDPIAQHVTIDGRPYRVVGVLAGRTSEAGGIGSLPSRNLNQAVLVPLPTLLSRSLELDPRQTVTEIWLHISDGSRVSDIGPIVERTLLRLHRGVADSEVVIPRELLRQRYRTQRTFSVVVGSVAALSLLVGGIGIMNIMLASVLERTREIGIRRTVGATRRDITLQFLVESLLMTMSGGAVGIVSGILVSWGITAYAGWTTRLSLLSVVLGFGVSVLVGVIFGLYPARKAAALQPIDALRYE
jgi:putative ABC transport system permease protein